MSSIFGKWWVDDCRAILSITTPISDESSLRLILETWSLCLDHVCVPKRIKCIQTWKLQPFLKASIVLVGKECVKCFHFMEVSLPLSWRVGQCPVVFSGEVLKCIRMTWEAWSMSAYAEKQPVPRAGPRVLFRIRTTWPVFLHNWKQLCWEVRECSEGN